MIKKLLLLPFAILFAKSSFSMVVNFPINTNAKVSLELRGALIVNTKELNYLDLDGKKKEYYMSIMFGRTVLDMEIRE